MRRLARGAVMALTLLTVAGIALGFVALGQIKRTGQGGHGLAVAGIAIGFVSAVLGLVGAYYLSR